MLLHLSLSNMPEYVWMCLLEQDSEYASGPKYAEIMSMAKFWIWQGSQYATPWQSSEYILGSKYKYCRVLNMQ